MFERQFSKRSEMALKAGVLCTDGVCPHRSPSSLWQVPPSCLAKRFAAFCRDMHWQDFDVAVWGWFKTYQNLLIAPQFGFIW